MLQPAGVTDAYADALSANSAAQFAEIAESEHGIRAILASADGGAVVTASSDMRLISWWPSADDGTRLGAALSGPRPAPDGGGAFGVRSLESGCQVIHEHARFPAPTGGPARPAGADYGGASECRAALTSLAFCGAMPSGALLAGSLDGTVRVYT